MSKKLQKSLQGYMKRITKETRNIQLPFGSISSSKDRVLAACKSTKKLAAAINRNARRLKSRKQSEEDTQNEIVKNEDAAATLTDIDRFLQENFKSLYLKDDDDARRKNTANEELNPYNDEDDEENDDRMDGENDCPAPIKFDSPKHSDLQSDLSRSERSIFGQPSSGLFTDDLNYATTTSTAVLSEDIESDLNLMASPIGRYQTDEAEKDSLPVLPEDCIAVLRYTSDPYEDFRQSMLETVKARIVRKGSSLDWDFMEELLICYLDMNDIKSHRFILGAFVDLIVALRQLEDRVP